MILRRRWLKVNVDLCGGVNQLWFLSMGQGDGCFAVKLIWQRFSSENFDNVAWYCEFATGRHTCKYTQNHINNSSCRKKWLKVWGLRYKYETRKGIINLYFIYFIQPKYFLTPHDLRPRQPVPKKETHQAIEHMIYIPPYVQLIVHVSEINLDISHRS